MTKNEDAVSPVVGVMLMLVVTIIIAAVVSGFAGGMAGGVEKTPQAIIVSEKIVINEAYDTDTTNWDPDQVEDQADDIYVLFEHMSGDHINLNNIEICLGSAKYINTKTTISNVMTPNTEDTGDSDHDSLTGFSHKWTQYLEGYPDHSTFIEPGDKFVLHADYSKRMDVYESTYGSDIPLYESHIYWKHKDAAGDFGVVSGDYLTFDIFDKKTGKVISSGEVPVPDFAVSS